MKWGRNLSSRPQGGGGTSREWELSANSAGILEARRYPAVWNSGHALLHTIVLFTDCPTKERPGFGVLWDACHPRMPRHPYYIGWWHGMAHERARAMAGRGVPVAQGEAQGDLGEIGGSDRK